MRKTKNDISYDAVDIDYQALISVARYTLANTTDVLISKLHTMREDLCSSKHSTTHIVAQCLPATVEQLVIAAETYDALKQGISRSNKHLVNVSKEQ